jgi:hypothetical protein
MSKEMHDLIVRNICTKDEWFQFLKVLADQKMNASDFFREIVKGAINDNEN